jgi:putative ATP-binding cassette transporter
MRPERPEAAIPLDPSVFDPWQPVVDPPDTVPLPPHAPASFATPDSRATLADLRLVCRGLWRSRFGLPLAALLSSICVVLAANMAGQVWLNAWNGAFFDAIEQKNLAQIGHELGVFLAIIAVLLTLVVAQTWLHEMTKLRLREWLTHRLLDDWLVPGRAYRLAIGAEAGINPDQRMQEDARHLTELSADLGISLLHHTFLLLTFLGVLWGLSRQVTFVLTGVHFAIPGYMVWCAFGYAALGSYLTWRVGRRLIALNATRYAREADLRFSLVRISECAEAIALHGGERDERRLVDATVDSVLGAVRHLVFALARLTWITSGYGWMAIVVPVVVALPGYLHGSLSLGGLMMVVGAFNQVQQALRWFVDNYSRIADWRAALYRIAVFDDALRRVDDFPPQTERIVLAEHPRGHLAFEHLNVQTASGTVVIADAHAEIAPGERVLIVGESGVGKSTLFRAIAGLWPWGSGAILLPPRERMMFMPQHPYLPLGTLRAATCYPDPPEAYSAAAVDAALARVGLDEFVPLLDRDERWDRLLSLGQQQRLAFARLLLQKPAWVFLDEATSALDLPNQARVMSLFDDEMKAATIVSIGHRPSLEEFHGRALQLVAAGGGASLQRRPENGSAPHPSS